MLIQSIIIKLTQPLVKATKMLMFQMDKISVCSGMHPVRSYPHIVDNSAFPPPTRPRILVFQATTEFFS